MALIGYARVSTEEQQTDPQLDVLRAAGGGAVFEERASGGRRSRIELTHRLDRIGRLARSLSHLLEVIERLRARGAHFRSLDDPSTLRARRASSPCRCSGWRPSWSGH